MAKPRVQVRGHREFIRACDLSDSFTKKEIRDTFKEVGEDVRRGARSRIDELSPRTARGYRTVVRQRGISVDQTLRKTTGLRGDWGDTQMKEGLIPALDEVDVEKKMEEAMQNVVDYFELKARWQGQGLLP